MNNYQNLNLPQKNLKIIKDGETFKIFDMIRKKFIRLTPEEWVRQHLIHYFIDSLNYPKGLIQIERGHSYQQKIIKRTDLVVFDTNGNPFLLVECKATSVKLDKEVLLQVATYNQNLKAPFLAISNGINHFCAKITDGKLTWLNEFPIYKYR